MGFTILMNAQNNDGLGVNLPKFYAQRLHFGFTIAGNQHDFRVNTLKNSALPDTIIDKTKYTVKSVLTKPAPGFALGLVADFRLQQYVRLRFTPSISFGSKKLEYTLANKTNDSLKKFEKSVESTFILSPLEMKIQSKRQGNFSAYIIGGGGYALDLASGKKVAGVSSSVNQLDESVKIKRDDIYYSAGAGTDFYLQYFKLGLELKLQVGTRNLLSSGNNIFSNSIEKVRSRMVVFTITFEG
jgi:hypothetical protein